MRGRERVPLFGRHREALVGEKSSEGQREYILEQQAEAKLWVGYAVYARYSIGVLCF